ncbi:UNKNOWN [Stylonychia lemnae]|uniref:Uncharacterized protein n=1 Tax=Stylonychia lemnae TaxID=5949 RepID=A0A078A4T4_STYLE|nr:UNKNOWN [Stylonychia lemnae]|eukprot:CDW76570.1 UNKNOWN [Stylonychia lemnae]
MNSFQHPLKVQQPIQPKYKNYNQRVDVITGSQNQTLLPADLYVTDPITGRKIIRRIKEEE